MDLPGDDEPWAVVTGDCLDVMAALPRHSFDAVITSPPYNLGGRPWAKLGNWKPGDGGSGGHGRWRNGSASGNGVRYGLHSDAMPHAEYVDWQRECLREMWRLLTPAGAIFYNHKPRVIGGRSWLPLELNPGLPLRQIVTWARAGGLNFNATAYVPTYEWVMVFAKPGFRLKSKTASGAGDVWAIAQEENPDHPAPFPVALPRRILSTINARRVLDPFCGIGSTGVACVTSGCHFLGIDLNPEYVAKARARIASAAGVGSLFDPGRTADLFAPPGNDAG